MGRTESITNSTPVCRVAVYCRISRDRIGDKAGVQRQQAECRELAAELGAREDCIELYEDNDVSATNGTRRPDFERLLADCAEGRVARIITWHTDRLYRLPRDLERLVEVLQHSNVRVSTVMAGQLDLSTPAGLMTAGVHAQMSQYEVRQKAARQKSQSAALAKTGAPRRGGRRPFGYEKDGVVLRETEANLLRDAILRILDGSSVLSILREWNAAGVKTVRGGRWTDSSFRAVLMRWRNAAVREHLGEPLYDGAWEPIVSREQLESLRALLCDPSRRTVEDRTRKHLLSFILRCGRCGDYLRAASANSRGKKYLTYQCPGRNGCRLGISYGTAERAVVDHVVSRITVPDEGLLRVTLRDRDHVRRLQAEWRELGARAGQIEESVISRARSIRILEQIEEQQRLVSNEIELIRQRQALASLVLGHGAYMEGGRASFERAIEARDKIRERFESLDLHQRRRIVKALCTVTVHPAEKGVRYTAANSPSRIEIEPLVLGEGCEVGRS